MTSAVNDFASIARRLNRLEQKAEWDAKNPKPEPVQANPVWTPEWGYGKPPADPTDLDAYVQQYMLDAWGIKF